MTVSTAELFEFGELTINESPTADYFIESLNFTPAQKKPNLVTNNDSDGSALADESHYTDSYIEWTIRVKWQGSTAATLAKLGELTDAHQAAEKIIGGQPLVWTVHGTETPYTGYVKTADIVSLPTTPSGDDAGWLIDAPVAKYKLTCSSFWSRPRRVIMGSIESGSEPLQTLYVGGVLGDVPARATMVLTDKAAQDRRFAPWGRDVVAGEELRTNLVPNPSFEVNTVGWVGGAGGFRTNTGATLTRDTGQHEFGTASAKLVTVGTKTLEGIDSEDTIPVSVGTTYRVSVYVKGNAGGEKLALRVGNGTVGSVTQNFAATAAWQRIDVAFTPTASGPCGIAVATQAASAVTFWVDGVLWEASALLGAYFDGGSAGAAWLGIAHQSRSVSSAAQRLLLSAYSGLSGAGFAGEAGTRAGAYLEEKVLRATAIAQPTVMFSTGRIAHVGVFGIYLRVWATSEAARFRISYRNGDGPLRMLEWKAPTVVGGWSELYMGEAFLDELDLGVQTSEIRVEQKAAEGNPANDGNYILLWPTGKEAARARGIAINSPTSLIGLDPFEQPEGNLEGKEPKYPSGVTWAEAVKTGASGFKVAATAVGHRVERTAVSDANFATGGCFALLGAAAYSTFQSTAPVKAGTVLRKNASRIGLLGRYVNASNYVAAVLTLQVYLQEVAFGTIKVFRGVVFLEMIKVIGGAVTELGAVPIAVFYRAEVEPTEYTLPADHQLQLFAAANGSWSASAPGDQKELSGQSVDLAAGGTLASGRIGLVDIYTPAAAGVRAIGTFEAIGADEPGRVCYAGRKVQFDSDGCQRQDPTGIYDGPPSMYRGADLHLEPAGELGLINRLAVRMRRNDNDVEEDSIVTDRHSTEISVEELFLHPR